ncbi:hypothetical protein [Photobacterium damselae]|uniref:hypothetical protein n=1 Tax=Photobacterium damselae TaxID=38293 RepID=UPI004067C27A
MSFSLFLTHHIKEKFPSRHYFIAKLNLYDSEFRNLDNVTLSRWCTGRTTPSLYKQILICDFIGENVFYFIKNKKYSLNSRSKNNVSIINTSMKKLENSVNNVSYQYQLNEKSKYNVYRLCKNNHRAKFQNFYLNFSIYSDIYSILNKHNIEIDNVVLTETINEFIVSHGSLSFIDKEAKKQFEFFFNLNKIPYNSFWFSNLSFQRSVKTVKLSFSLLFYFIYMTNNKIFLSLLRGEETFNNLSEIGYEKIANTIIDTRENIYLMKCDIFKVIAHPTVITILNETLNKYNLEQFFSQEIKDKYFKR